MRTSLTEIELIERYLNHSLAEDDRLVVEARMITDYTFRINVFLQRKINQLIKLYYRKTIRSKAEQFHTRLFSDPEKKAYKKSILQLFQ